jgi:hypothetical protein
MIGAMALPIMRGGAFYVFYFTMAGCYLVMKSLKLTGAELPFILGTGLPYGLWEGALFLPPPFTGFTTFLLKNNGTSPDDDITGF